MVVRVGPFADLHKDSFVYNSDVRHPWAAKHRLGPPEFCFQALNGSGILALRPQSSSTHCERDYDQDFIGRETCAIASYIEAGISEQKCDIGSKGAD